MSAFEYLRHAEELLELARRAGQRIAVAESCTGGLLSGVLTEIPGSSDVFECGFVTYSNAAKTHMLGVDAGLIAQHGAVSGPVAAAMAQGAAQKAGVNLSVAITGVAGPGGGTAEKPVGLVWFGTFYNGHTHSEAHHFSGNRREIRVMAVANAIALLKLQLS